MSSTVVAMDTESQTTANRGWGHNFRVEPTKAMPKDTLFGSCMERVDKEKLQQANKLDLDSVKLEREPRYKVRNLPPILYAEVHKPPDSDDVRRKKMKVEKSKKNLHTAQNALKILETQARYYPGEVIHDKQPTQPPPREDRQHQWMTERDLKHANEINILGVRNGTKNFNWDKYKNKPPVHQYSIIGDVFRPGMDFNNNFLHDENPGNQDPDMYKTQYMQDNQGYRQTQGPNPSEQDSKIVIDLPQNIKHLFRTKQCEELLCDKKKVDDALHFQKERHKLFYKPRESSTAHIIGKKPNINPLYEMMGNALRYNNFPGYTYDQKKSQAKEVYTQDVFDRRTKDPDHFRMKRDALSDWAESNVLRERMKKAWNQHHEETLGAKK